VLGARNNVVKRPRDHLPRGLGSPERARQAEGQSEKEFYKPIDLKNKPEEKEKKEKIHVGDSGEAGLREKAAPQKKKSRSGQKKKRK